MISTLISIHSRQRSRGGERVDLTHLTNDALDEGRTGGLLSLAVRGLGDLGDDSSRVTRVESPGEV